MLLDGWRQAYARFQPVVTRLSAAAPVAIMDVLLVAIGAGVIWMLWARRAHLRFAPLVLAVVLIVGASWLLFLMLWGWHYQTPTIEARLALAPADVSRDRGEAFARTAVAQLNALHEAAHATPWPRRAELPGVLAPRLAAVLPRLGTTWMPRLPTPRATVLDAYFRAGGIDGMTNPFGLEILLNTRVLPIELPALVAHEYAHLAGFADEADASVVAWLACQGGTPNLRYSSTLAVLPHLLAGLPREMQQAIAKDLGPGPRDDLRAIATRLSEQRPWVQAFAWRTYDRFLRANRVAEGVARYDAVARVLIGAADPVSGTLHRWPAR